MSDVQTLRGSALVDAIRDEIITRGFAPGSRLTEPALAARYDVSRVPVREALRSLASEGFIELRPYGSTVVCEITDTIAQEVRSARIILEPHAARGAALHRSVADLQRMEEIIADGDAVIARDSFTELHRLNSKFHEAVAASCGNSVLAGFVKQLTYRSEWINNAAIMPSDVQVWDDHEEIASAIRDGNGPLAESLMMSHVLRTFMPNPGGSA